MEAQEVFGVGFDPAEFEQMSDTSAEDYEDDDDEVLLSCVLFNVC